MKSCKKEIRDMNQGLFESLCRINKGRSNKTKLGAIKQHWKDINIECACLNCSDTKRLKVAHRIHPKRGGDQNSKYNLIPLCTECRKSKGMIDLDLWLTWLKEGAQDHRVCESCASVKPINDFSKPQQRNKYSKCLKCQKLGLGGSSVGLTVKACRKCNTEKLLSDFYKAGKFVDGSPRYYSYCKNCHGKYTKNWSDSNYEQHRDIITTWFDENPRQHKFNVMNNHSKSKMKEKDYDGKVHKFNYHDLAGYWAKCGISDDTCYYSKWSECNGGFEHHEHMVPMSRGGDHSMANIVPSCKECNESKGTKTREEFIEFIKKQKDC